MTATVAARRFVADSLDAIESVSPGSLPDVQTYRFGPETIEVTYRSPTLSRLLSPAFRHVLTSEIASPGERLVIADPETVGAAMPPLPWDEGEYRACGEIPGFIEGSQYTHLNVPMAALTVMDEEMSRAAYWCRRPDDLPTYEIAGPLRAFLHRHFIRKRRMPLLHAAAVALDGKAVLIIGGKGAGKSTTTLSCLAAGLGYLGDDKLLVDVSQRRAFSLYSCAKFFIGEADRLPLKGVADHLHHPRTADDRKALLYIDQFAPAQMVKEARIAAIIQCNIAHTDRSSLSPLDPAHAVRLLVADNVGLFPSTAAATLTAIAALCRAVPCLRLNAGRDLTEVADCVANYIRTN